MILSFGGHALVDGEVVISLDSEEHSRLFSGCLVCVVGLTWGSCVRMDFETLKQAVWKKLPEMTLEELTEITTGLSLNVPPEKQGQQSAVYGAVVKHLMSDVVEQATDGGEQVFTIANGVIDQLLSKRVVETPEVKSDVKVEHTGRVLSDGSGSSHGPTVPAATPVTTPGVAPVSGAANTTMTTTTTAATTTTSSMSSDTVQSVVGGSGDLTADLLRLLQTLVANQPRTSVMEPPAPSVTNHVRRLTDFKINGVIGKGEGQLDYAALMYRIRDGYAKGYRTPEIISGVINALKPGCELRRFFESAPAITEEKFKQMLKSHYDITNATKILTELSGCIQEPTQGEREYMVKMMRLKNTLIIVAEEEGFHMNEERIYETFIHAVSVGLRNTAVRLELQPILEKRLPDEDLSWEVNKIVTRDEEHRKKMGSKNANVNLLDVEEANGGSKKKISFGGEKTAQNSKEDMILAELRNLSTDVKVLATVKEDVQVLTTRMDGYDKRLDDLAKMVSGEKKDGETDAADNSSKSTATRCENCVKASKRWCHHCTKCGEGGHKRNSCTKN